MVLFFVVLGALFGAGQEISLVPAEPSELGDWAQVTLPLRLYPTPSQSLSYEGAPLVVRLYGEIALGTARYTFMLGVNAEGEAGLWLDSNGDNRLTEEEKGLGISIQGGMVWSFELLSRPVGADPFPYKVTLIWPEGRSYVFLSGGAPRAGEWRGHKLAAIDGDLDGIFGTKGDFLGVDVDGDGVIYAEPDGHEHFSLSEPFTLGEESFKLLEISADGLVVKLGGTAYVPPKVPLIPGAPAPDFSFSDFLTGKTLSLSDLRGKVVLLDFWATWCPPCMESLPKLVEIYREFHHQGFEIVGVSLDESEEELRRVLASYNIPWPIAFAGKRWDNPIANLYRVYQIPTTYLLDEKGLIRLRDPKEEALPGAIAELLGEAAGSTSTTILSPKPILEIQVPEQIELKEGVEKSVPLNFVNASPYLAEEVEISLVDLPSSVESHVPPPFLLQPSSEKKLELKFFVQNAQITSIHCTLSVRYRYCVGDTCFQVTQEKPIFLVLVGEAEREFPHSLWFLVLLALGLLVSLIFFGQH